MAAREKRSVHLVEQLEKMFPFVTSACPSGEDVCELASDVHIFDLGVQFFPVEQPVQSHPVGTCNMFYRWTSAFCDHLDYSFIVFKNMQQSVVVRTFCVRSDVVKLSLSNNFLPTSEVSTSLVFWDVSLVVIV